MVEEDEYDGGEPLGWGQAPSLLYTGFTGEIVICGGVFCVGCHA